jgi:hypothetical protein
MVETADTVVGPGDPGWSIAGAVTPVEQGYYVDLGYSPTQKVSAFSLPNERLRPALSELVANGFPSLTQRQGVGATPSSTYDTWSVHYEHDGIDQDRDGLVDEGTDGFDNDNINGVDDPGEWETSPPYTSPLRGIEVKIRVYEPDSRQIREVTVRQSFVPE